MSDLNKIKLLPSVTKGNQVYKRYKIIGDQEFIRNSTDGVLKVTWSPFDLEAIVLVIEGSEEDLLLTMMI